MNYSYVKLVEASYEFVSDDGHTFKDIVYGSQYLDSLSDLEIVEIGIYRTVLLPVPINAKQADGTMYFNKVGNIVEYRPNYTLYSAEEQLAQLTQHFTDATTAYIAGKVADYNKANGLAFKDIDAFTKYAINNQSPHYNIASRFVGYADRVWSTVRGYQATTTTIPTDVEFKTVLDSVVF